MTFKRTAGLVLLSALLATTPGFAQSQEAPPPVDTPVSYPLAELHSRAQGGDAEAQTELGSTYENARGAANYGEAVRWYRVAAEQGFAKAQYHLGLMHHHGYGVPKDAREAAKWFRQAAEQNYAKAQGTLAAYYFAMGPETDAVQARFWFHLAASNGDASAVALKKALARTMTAEQIAEADSLASTWLIRRAKDDEAAWDVVQKSPRAIDMYQAYLRAYPSGLHGPDARDALAWREAEVRGTNDAMRVYLAAHPRGRYASRAKAIQRLLGTSAQPALAGLIHRAADQLVLSTLHSLLPPGVRAGRPTVPDEKPFELSLGEHSAFSSVSSPSAAATVEIWLAGGTIFYTTDRGSWPSDNTRCVVGRVPGFPFTEFTEYRYRRGGWHFQRSVFFDVL